MNDTTLTATGSVATSPSERLFYLDWLRVGGVTAVLLFHCAKIFDIQTTVMFNQVRSPLLSASRDFGYIWLMPMFFVISGGAIWFSTASAGAGRFLKAKFLRLMVPLLFVGTFVINAVYVWVERLFQGQAGSFFEWYPQYFKGMYGFGGNFAPLGMGTYLWYLMYLFVFCLLLLPFFLRSKKSGTSLLSRLSTLFENPAALVLLFIPVSLAGWFFEYMGMSPIRVTGHWDAVSYLLFLVYGYLIFANERIMAWVRKMGPVCLILALVAAWLMVAAHFGYIFKVPGITGHDLAHGGARLPLDHQLWSLYQGARGLVAWLGLIGIIGCASRLLNFNNSSLAYANEAVLPFYILHHAVVYLIGFVVIKWNLAVGVKYGLIAVLSFAAVMVIYEVLVRRINLVRWLFGLKPQRGG